REGLLDRRGPFVGAFLEEGKEEVGLPAGKVVVEGTAGEASGVGDLVEARPTEPPLPEDRSRADEEPAAGVLPSLGLRQALNPGRIIQTCRNIQKCISSPSMGER